MVTHPCGDHSVISMASRKRKAIDLDIKYQILLLNVEVMFYFNC
jgi:hypothetical protein